MSGSFIFETRVPDVDPPAVRRLKQAGGVMLGKTTTPEFGWKGLGDSPFDGHHAQPLEHGHDDGRLQRRRRRGHRGRAGSASPGLGRRRIDPHSQRLLRDLRAQALVRARSDVADLQQRLRLAHGADDANGRGCRADAVGHGGAGRLGSHVARGRARRLRRQARRRNQGTPSRVQCRSGRIPGRCRGRHVGGAGGRRLHRSRLHRRGGQARLRRLARSDPLSLERSRGRELRAVSAPVARPHGPGPRRVHRGRSAVHHGRLRRGARPRSSPTGTRCGRSSKSTICS